jgi:indolepyruvate ferredoxin oxidoreductase alpha subunit
MIESFNAKPGTRQLLLGNEAIARGAIEGGVQVAAAYPGTPSSEIMETLIDTQDQFGFYAEWSVNEKVAFEIAAGAAVIGARSLASMKGAGINVAMDMLMTLPITGVRGGMVVVIADDPGAHYSSNEQDSRMAAQWTCVPCLEPENQHEAKEMTKAAFGFSEAVELPVILRSVTRISHSSGVVEFGEVKASEMVIGFNKHWKIPFRWNVYGPPDLVSKHKWQIDQLETARAWIDKSGFNPMYLKKTRLGIVATGIGAGYAREALQDLGITDKVNLWKVGIPYPLVPQQAKKFLEACDKILVVEDGTSLFENQLRAYCQEIGLKVEILGKEFSGPLSPVGELTTDLVYEVVAEYTGTPVKKNNSLAEIQDEISALSIPRSSTLCAGCPHLGTYWGILQALPQGAKVVPIINGDIGCYEQAGYGIKGQMPEATDLPSKRHRPLSLYTVLDTLYVMGSGISMAQGEQRAGYTDGPIVAVAGDSTFFHATLPALINAIWNKTKVTFVVLDNSWTAMTGHQPSPTTEDDDCQKSEISIESVARGLGVPLVRVVDAYDINAVTAAVREAVEFDGVSVVISRRDCALQVFRKSDEPGHVYVDQDLCNGCKNCVYVGCPAIIYKNKRASIDPILCVSCGVCIQVCPQYAIMEEK